MRQGVFRDVRSSESSQYGRAASVKDEQKLGRRDRLPPEFQDENRRPVF